MTAVTSAEPDVPAIIIDRILSNVRIMLLQRKSPDEIMKQLGNFTRMQDDGFPEQVWQEADRRVQELERQLARATTVRDLFPKPLDDFANSPST